MAKDEKRISINALEKIAKEQFSTEVKERWFDIEVTIKRVLPLTEMIGFVNEVVDACILIDGCFHPGGMDFAEKSGILTHYANFTLPDNLEKQYWLIYQTDAADMVCRHIDTVQLREIVNAANRKIDYLCDSDAAAVKAKLDSILKALADAGDRMEEAFSNVSAEDLQRLASALAEGGLSEEKVVSAYMEQAARTGNEPAPEGAERA